MISSVRQAGLAKGGDESDGVHTLARSALVMTGGCSYVVCEMFSSASRLSMSSLPIILTSRDLTLCFTAGLGNSSKQMQVLFIPVSLHCAETLTQRATFSNA